MLMWVLMLKLRERGGEYGGMDGKIKMSEGAG